MKRVYSSILVFIFLIVSPFLISAEMTEKEAFSKLVNDMPYCYVVLEISELNVKSEMQPYAKFFYLYNQAYQELIEPNLWYKIPVAFNQQAREKRKEILHLIKGKRDYSETLKRVYRDYGCGKYAEI
ncbi:hypothetical protein ACE02B_07340 [Shewanella mangrovisoli]|uniref:hypothetical protein n=1 Tax=Shewanella mangrovisoli TaxID=2864211 RepID=UPI0035B76936